MADRTLSRTPSQLKLQKLFAALANQPLMSHEIAKLLYLSDKSTQDYLRLLRERGQVHIKRWTRKPVEGKKEYARPLWAMGSGKDAPKPPRFTRQQNSARQYAKTKKDPVKYEEMLMKARHKYQVRTFQARPDVAAAWIVRSPT